MTSALFMAESWRLPGCGPECRPRQHDPIQHERYGRLTGRLASPGGAVTVGSLTVDLDAELVTVDGRAIHLPPNEWGVLAVLAANRGRVVTHDEIVAAVWGPSYLEADATATRHMLRVNVGRIRQRLGAAADVIVTTVGRGFGIDIPPRPAPVLWPKPPRRWARHWDACQWCHSADGGHAGRGLCKRCYARQLRAGKFL